MSALLGSVIDLKPLQDLQDIAESLPSNNSNGNDDDDQLAHYVHKDDMMNGFVYGEPVLALCGKIWVPVRDGSEFPVCSECKEIYDSIPSGSDDE